MSSDVGALRVTEGPFRGRAPFGVIVGLVAAGALIVGLIGPFALVAVVGAIAAAVVWLRMPGVLLATYLFLPYYKHWASGFSPVDLTLVLAILCASQGVFILLGRVGFNGSRFGITLFALLGVTVLVGVTWAGDQALALNGALLWWGFIFLPCFVVVRVASDVRFINHFLTAAFAFGSAIVVLGLPDVFGPERLAVLGENTQQTGEITVMVALLAVTWLARSDRIWIRLLAIPIIPIALAESLASGSRGPIVAFGVVLGAMALRRLASGPGLTRSEIRLAALGLLALVPLAFAVSRLPAQSLSRFFLLGEALGPGGTTSSSIAAREDLFSVATQLFANRPLLGNGTASFADYASTHVGLTTFAYPHNDLLQMAAEFGLIGAALFVLFIGNALFRRIPEESAWWTIRWMILLWVTLGLISGDLYNDRLMWGLLVLMTCAPAVVAIAKAVSVEEPAEPARVPLMAAQALIVEGPIPDVGQIRVTTRYTHVAPRVEVEAEPAVAAIVPAAPPVLGAIGAELAPERLDLNRATEIELMMLPGIGRATAAKIIVARDAQPFSSVGDLLARGLVNRRTFDAIEGSVTVVPVRAPRRSRRSPGTSQLELGGATIAVQPSLQPLDLNRASLTELTALPGIGRATAARIVSSRDEVPFGSIDELGARGLLSARRLAAIEARLTIVHREPLQQRTKHRGVVPSEATRSRPGDRGRTPSRGVGAGSPDKKDQTGADHEGGNQGDA